MYVGWILYGCFFFLDKSYIKTSWCGLSSQKDENSQCWDSKTAAKGCLEIKLKWFPVVPWSSLWMSVLLLVQTTVVKQKSFKKAGEGKENNLLNSSVQEKVERSTLAGVFRLKISFVCHTQRNRWSWTIAVHSCGHKLVKNCIVVIFQGTT